MPYITIQGKERKHQVTLDELLDGATEYERITANPKAGTVTRFYKELPENFKDKVNVNLLTIELELYYIKYKEIIDTVAGKTEKNPESKYSTWKIPKKSGGLREIKSPNDDLKEAQYDFIKIIKKSFADMYDVCLYHTNAYAYIENRSTLDAIKKHQGANSNWFLKTDFSNFFNSTTKEFTMKMLSLIYPFSELMKNEEGNAALSDAIDVAFLNGGLPQGTPISPMLTNLIMIPIDHYLTNTLIKDGFIYTRYADDIIISHKKSFIFKDKVNYINSILEKFEAPFSIKQQKTRYGSKNGSNWNLGLMLNKDNKITIGYKKKKIFKAMIFSYMKDRENNIKWSYEDMMHLRGLMSYFEMIEKEYINYVINHVGDKFNKNIKKCLTEDIKKYSAINLNT